MREGEDAKMIRMLIAMSMVGCSLMIGWTGPDPGWAKTGCSLAIITVLFMLAMFVANLCVHLRNKANEDNDNDDGVTSITITTRK